MIFSRVWAAPAPLMSVRSGATSSAPSMAMSMRSISVEVDQGNSQLPGEHERLIRGRDGADVPQLARLQSLGERGNGVDCGRARAQAHHHPGGDAPGSCLRGGSLQLVGRSRCHEDILIESEARHTLLRRYSNRSVVGSGKPLAFSPPKMSTLPLPSRVAVAPGNAGCTVGPGVHALVAGS